MHEIFLHRIEHSYLRKNVGNHANMGKNLETNQKGGRDMKHRENNEDQAQKDSRASNRKRWILLIIEIAVLVIVIGLLYVETRIERINKADLSIDNLAADSAASSATEEVKADERSTEAATESADVTGQDQYREIAQIGRAHV